MSALSRRWPLLLALALLGACRRESPPAPQSAFPGAPVILISIDTLRADHLPAWGYDAVRTPNIDALRADAVLFRNAYSQVPLTLPSHTSILTGLLPADHGVRDNVGYRFTSTAGATLPQALQQQGYATGASVSAYVLRGSTGLAPLFEWYDDPIAFAPRGDLGSIQRPGAETVASARSWIAARGNAPFFFMLHLFEPHTPYDAPEPYRSATAEPYDAEIAHADAILGTFLDGLRQQGIYDRAIIILLSDHGEGLGEHGEREHGIFVYREAIHVPLLIKLPKNAGAGGVVETPAALVDVFPTVLSLTGAQPRTGLAGVALLGPAAKPLPPRRIFSESLYARLHLGWSDLRSLIDDRHHYIDAPRPELYAWPDDPREQKNVLADDRRATASFRAELARYEKKLTAPGAASSEEMAKLTALGYISAPSAAASGERADPKDVISQLTRYSTAREALARGETDAAIAQFRAVLQENPDFADASLGLVEAYEAAGRNDDVIEVYRGLLTRNPALTEQVAIGLATAFLNAGRLAEARQHAELALPSNPAAAHLLLGRIALAAKKPMDAQQQAREAARDPHYAPQAVLLLNDALLAAGPEHAAEALRVLDEYKKERVARGEAPALTIETARAGALMRLGRIDEAIAALQAEIRLQPGSREAYGRLAAIHLLRKDVPAAEAALELMVRNNPTPASYALAVQTLAHFGQRERAEEWRRRGMNPTALR
jgi:tetratricopeptide (TPR) repeat protein